MEIFNMYQDEFIQLAAMWAAGLCVLLILYLIVSYRRGRLFRNILKDGTRTYSTTSINAASTRNRFGATHLSATGNIHNAQTILADEAEMTQRPTSAISPVADFDDSALE